MLVIGLAFVGLLIVGAPIGIALGAPAVLYLVMEGFPLAVLVQRMTQVLNSFPLLAIPLFIVAGRLMNDGGLTKRIFRFARNMVGWIPGGLGHVNIIDSVVFSGMSGTAIADIAGMGQVEIRAMRSAGYPGRFVAGITAASAIVGPILPPSIPFLLFALASDASLLALFAGGVIPGLVIAFALLLTAGIYAYTNNLPRHQTEPIGGIVASFFGALPALFAPVLMIGGMMSGILSPTEAAGTAVLYTLFISLFVYRELKISDLPQILRELLSSVANLSFVIAAGLLFSWVLVLEEVPQTLIAGLLELSDSKWVLLCIVMAFFLIIGCFIEATIVFLVVAPMVLPTLKMVGVNDVHFGVLTVFAMTIGLYTPPVGLALYIIKDLCEISFEEAVRSVAPFIMVFILLLILFIFVPEIVTYLPERLGLLR